MNPRLSRAYVTSSVQSSSPGQLVVMLYDGLLRFANEALENMRTGKSAAQPIDRCIRIITELNLSLKFEVAPKLCNQLANLYEYYVVEFSKAMHQNKPQIVEGLIPLITTLRDAWVEAERQVSNKG
jgi:flagellar protein FliS